MKTLSVNREQKLYLIPFGDNGFTTLGFNYAFDEATAICEELRIQKPLRENIGTIKGYDDYLKAVECAKKSGKRLTCGLTRQLIGLEGSRVEVVTTYGEKRRFKVGKSTGFIPCHLEISNARSKSGVSAENEYKSVTVIRSK